MNVVGLNCGDNSLGMGGDSVCSGVTGGGEVSLVFCTGLKYRRCF